MVNGGGVMKDRLLKTIKENGFLIFLFICVCLVAVSTIFVATKEVDKPKGQKDLVILDDDEKKDVVLDSSRDKDQVDSIETTTKDDSDVEEEIDETELDDLKQEDVSTDDVLQEEIQGEIDDNEPDEVEIIQDRAYELSKDTKKSTGFIMPVEGEIITPFTEDVLIYSKTLDEWRGHTGIDIKSDLGTKVKAIGDGVVKDVYEDSLWGNVIVIDHENGFESRYANLGTREMVNVGIRVKQGDHISTIGNSAGIEMLMDSHLHFEVIKDGKIVDPRSIIK